MQPQTFAIIQARMTSSRLPGKVLLDIGGEPMLVRVVERARRAKTINGVVLATTTDPSDDTIAALCVERGYPCYRGNLYDVLDRYYQAARMFGAEVIVRLTGDCPVIDPGVIDELVDAFLAPLPLDLVPSSLSPAPFDFATIRLPPPWHRTYPIGLDTEVCTFAALERAWVEADQPHQREHVMPYLYEGIHEPRARYLPSKGKLRDIYISPRGFYVLVMNHDPDYGSMRWTVDTPEDLELLRQIYARFPGRDDFTWLEVLDLFQREPELARINAEVHHKDFRASEKPTP
jgi:spore coat polysaccharide biosynthesis protein SpsF